MKTFGKYLILMSSLFTNRERFGVYLTRIIDEAVHLGINSIMIVSIVSFFIGAVTAIQTALNLVSPLVPAYIIGTIVRDMTVLELAPTIISVVLAGKVGSHIAGQLGTMRITEQVDALEVMGINSASYLILPKIVATLITFPMLVSLAAFLSIFGGYLAGTLTEYLTEQQYVYGIRYGFSEYNIFFMTVKAFVFAFLISSISSFEGYFTKGGALEVGEASTSAVTKSCIAVLLADYLLAELLL